MSTIVVHGTFDSQGTWWRTANHGSFLAAVAAGMREGGKQPDLWQIGGSAVGDWPQLRVQEGWSFWSGRQAAPFQHLDGYFHWSGTNLHDAGRTVAGPELARYLETLAAISPDEEIDLIAHSHGGNVVKLATTLAGANVRIGRIVLLATPHFQAVGGGSFLYPLNAARLAGAARGCPSVLNVYSDEDSVQVGLADHIADMGLPPGLPALEFLNFQGTPVVDSRRSDSDPAVADAYDNLQIPTALGSGPAVHSALHGPTIGRLVGLWLGRWPDWTGVQCCQQIGLRILEHP